jgi:crossover junction endodeoxyribonuclease RuvC
MASATHRVLGLDPGSRVLGYALVERLERGAFTYRECGTIAAPDRAPVAERLLELATGLREVIRELAPTEAAMEDVFHQRNARSALVLGQARGAILLVVAEHGLAVASYPPATVKRTVCGNGRAAKEQIQQMVTALTGLRRPPPIDAADALAVAICHCLHASTPAALRPPQRRRGPR